MKPVFAFLLTGVILTGVPVLFAQDKDIPSKNNSEQSSPTLVRTQLEYIVIPTATATKLMYGEKKAANDSDLRQQLQALLESEKARMLESQMLTSRHQEKATSESILELIYPTEYEPSELPDEVYLADKKGECR